MLELAILPGIELGKFVLGQVLDLGQPVLEGYVQDFFKDCLEGGVARLQAGTLKQPMAEAIGFFIQRFVKELQFNDIPDTSIDHHYAPALKQFVRDKAVCALLGKAFETDCKKIDHDQLANIWTAQHQTPGWQFPAEEFDWRGVCKEYVVQVKAIAKADPELRAILDSDHLAQIAQNTAQLSPGFDLATYRASLQASYGYLKLYTLDSTDRADNIQLWRMFIEQTVREALPPMRYDLPLDLKRQLQEQGQLEADLSTEALELYRREYFQQPARKVLEVVADAQRAVILGDPGSGKSTLLQFLALDWVEGKTEALPLLIELREYALAQSHNFLDFLHRGKGADWQFDPQKLHQHLLDHPTLVMFDGLDEVFDRPTQAAIIDDIIRFAQQYPQARILVTSRIIGYPPERFQHAGFRQFTLQPLDEGERHEFIDRWYDLSMGSDPDKVQLKQRLKEAIANSKAIQNLADNPLLLTMMAILNRRQELPRDRADLYDQASRVLLYHWDVDHKRLNLPMDAIGRREKQEMLRAIAYEMQAGDEGLKGNLIHADRLIRLITDYLRDQGFSEPREKASRLIQQLRERNFILCYRGADTYGFMHRTFLEYFCAVEIVHRFEKQRTLTFEQLRDEVFGQHWQDETWHEVLRLICGLIGSIFSGLLIQFLMEIEVDRSQFLDSPDNYRDPEIYLRIEALRNLTLASDCLSEVKNRNQITDISDRLFSKFRDEIENQTPYPFGFKAASIIADSIAITWQEDEKLLDWLKNGVENNDDWHWHWFTRRAIGIIARNWNKNPDILKWLKKLVEDGHSDWGVSESAVKAIACFWKSDISTLPWLKYLAQHNELWATRRGAVESLAKYWKDDPDTLCIAIKVAQSDENWATRDDAINTLAQHWGSNLDLINIFSEIAVNDPGGEKGYTEGDPRYSALRALLTKHPEHSKTAELLQDRSTNDPDEQLRHWAQEQLEKLEIQN